MHQTLDFVLRHGYWVLGSWVLAEQMGLPVPALPILLAMGALTGTHYSFATAALVVLLAATSADTAWYFLGRNKGHSVLKLLCRISLEPDSCVSSTRAWFKSLGGWSLVIAKFVPGLSTVATPMAGLSRMPLWKFLVADGAGTLLWGAAYMGIGFAFREQLEDAAAALGQLGGSVVLLIAAITGLWLGLKFWQRKRFIRSLRIARIAPEEVLARLAEVCIVDVRSEAEVEFDGMKLPGALWFDRKEIALHHQRIPRDRDVILYCT
jgi:membrane protein DedA with SNARE-associated domain